MLDGISIPLDMVVKLFTYSAVTGMAVSLFLWFLGMTLSTALQAFKKGMNSKRVYIDKKQKGGKKMIPVLGAENPENTFSIAESIGGVVTKFTSGMGEVAKQGIELISSAAPYIIAVVGAGIAIGMGIKWLKQIRH